MSLNYLRKFLYLLCNLKFMTETNVCVCVGGGEGDRGEKMAPYY
jgi:hypothetical protein